MGVNWNKRLAANAWALCSLMLISQLLARITVKLEAADINTIIACLAEDKGNTTGRKLNRTPLFLLLIDDVCVCELFSARSKEHTIAAACSCKPHSTVSLFA